MRAIVACVIEKFDWGAILARMTENVSAGRLESSSRDLWVRNQIAFLRGESAMSAAGLVQPRTTEEVVAAVLDCVQRGRKIVPLGAGSGVCGGISATGDEWLLDLKALRSIDVRPDEGIAVFGAGVMGRHAEEACNKLGWTIGHFPSSIACSSVGGWVAARGAGQLSSRYGKMEDICVGATAVLADGSVRTAYRGSQELAEWVGNEGTLAVITKVILRIRPVREGWTFSAFLAPDLTTALQAAKQFVRQRPVASLIRVYDPIDSRVALSHSKGGMARRLPWMLAMPQLTRLGGDLLLRKSLVIVGWEGAGPVWQDAKVAVDAIGRALRLKDLGTGPGELWLARRHDVSFKQISILRSSQFADTFEVACPWTRVEAVYHAVRKAISPEAVSMAHFSHAYSEGSAIYFTMAGKLPGYDRTWDRALAAASAAGATISHHHGVGRLKAPLMVHELGGTHQVLLDAKAEHDPKGLLNPGCLGIPGPVRAAPPHEGYEGVDRGNGLWAGSLATVVGEIESKIRRYGWTLGWSLDASETLETVLKADLVNAESTRMGSAADRVVAVEGELDDGTPFGTRVTPRAATGPDLRRRLLSSTARLDRVTLRLHRRPESWRHLFGEFEDPLDVARRAIVANHQPWAASVRGRRVDLWWPADTPACAGLGELVQWSGSQDTAGPQQIDGVKALVRGAWRPWSELVGSEVWGLDCAGGWQSEES